MYLHPVRVAVAGLAAAEDFARSGGSTIVSQPEKVEIFRCCRRTSRRQNGRQGDQERSGVARTAVRSGFPRCQPAWHRARLQRSLLGQQRRMGSIATSAAIRRFSAPRPSSIWHRLTELLAADRQTKHLRTGRPQLRHHSHGALLRALRFRYRPRLFRRAAANRSALLHQRYRTNLRAAGNGVIKG